MDPVVLSAIISAAISTGGMLLSALIAWLTARHTAKIKAKAEIEKLKMELQHDDKVREETIAREQEQAIRQRYQEMISAVTEYMSKHDVNYRAKALNAVMALPAAKNERLNDLVQNVRLAIKNSDAFEGPKYPRLSEDLEEIRIEAFQ